MGAKGQIGVEIFRKGIYNSHQELMDQNSRTVIFKIPFSASMTLRSENRRLIPAGLIRLNFGFSASRKPAAWSGKGRRHRYHCRRASSGPPQTERSSISSTRRSGCPAIQCAPRRPQAPIAYCKKR